MSEDQEKLTKQQLNIVNNLDRVNDKDFKATAPDIAKTSSEVNFTKTTTSTDSSSDGQPSAPGSKYKYYPDNPVSNYHKQNFASKGPSRYYDPCQESANMSIRCLESNNFDREMCGEYFKAYRECKKEWMSQRRKDIMEGKGGWS
ncbi:hypothetical protein WICPIJ_002692 [Wickerhamomyces pijperi]|uniref:Cytochrome c oxidase-assembly factor COX23, mitochondrial n=1 Tax=Wickerhamomyces pijperi TaxID=599730 RepID=A0A9P8TPK7_WICPI|nr:hypothetical protein WICPIJ_002692 [Wickerhamomyces pijperi]